MKNTSLLCLSSPEGDSNYYSGLMNLKKENGDSFFNGENLKVLLFSAYLPTKTILVINCFQICAKCLKLERIKQINCTHIKSTAHWLSSKKIKELKQLYKASPEDAIREFGGIVVSDYKPALRKEEVERCFAAEPFVTICAPTYIFTTCDPNGGGPSHMSIASGYFSKLGDIVVSFLCCQICLSCGLYKVPDDVDNVHFVARPVERCLCHALQMLDEFFKVQVKVGATQVSRTVLDIALENQGLNLRFLSEDEQELEKLDCRIRSWRMDEAARVVNHA